MLSLLVVRASVCIYGRFPTYERGYIGFRVVAVPEPTLLALLVLRRLGMLVERTGQPAPW